MKKSDRKIATGSVQQKKRSEASGSYAPGSIRGRDAKTTRSAKTGRFVYANLDQRPHSTKVTSKGQITVPKKVREHLNLDKGDRIEFLIGVDGKVTIMAATADVRKLKGMVAKHSKPVSIDEMNRAIEAEGGNI